MTLSSSGNSEGFTLNARMTSYPLRPVPVPALLQAFQKASEYLSLNPNQSGCDTSSTSSSPPLTVAQRLRSVASASSSLNSVQELVDDITRCVLRLEHWHQQRNGPATTNAESDAPTSSLGWLNLFQLGSAAVHGALQRTTSPVRSQWLRRARRTSVELRTEAPSTSLTSVVTPAAVRPTSTRCGSDVEEEGNTDEDPHEEEVMAAVLGGIAEFVSPALFAGVLSAFLAYTLAVRHLDAHKDSAECSASPPECRSVASRTAMRPCRTTEGPDVSVSTVPLLLGLVQEASRLLSVIRVHARPLQRREEGDAVVATSHSSPLTDPVLSTTQAPAPSHDATLNATSAGLPGGGKPQQARVMIASPFVTAATDRGGSSAQSCATARRKLLSLLQHLQVLVGLISFFDTGADRTYVPENEGKGGGMRVTNAAEGSRTSYSVEVQALRSSVRQFCQSLVVPLTASQQHSEERVDEMALIWLLNTLAHRIDMELQDVEDHAGNTTPNIRILPPVLLAPPFIHSCLSAIPSPLLSVEVLQATARFFAPQRQQWYADGSMSSSGVENHPFCPAHTSQSASDGLPCSRPATACTPALERFRVKSLQQEAWRRRLHRRCLGVYPTPWLSTPLSAPIRSADTGGAASPHTAASHVRKEPEQKPGKEGTGGPMRRLHKDPRQSSSPVVPRLVAAHSPPPSLNLTPSSQAPPPLPATTTVPETRMETVVRSTASTAILLSRPLPLSTGTSTSSPTVSIAVSTSTAEDNATHTTNTPSTTTCLGRSEPATASSVPFKPAPSSRRLSAASPCRRAVPPGLRNPGSSSFMNAAFQFLASATLFCDALQASLDGQPDRHPQPPDRLWQPSLPESCAVGCSRLLRDLVRLPHNEESRFSGAPRIPEDGPTAVSSFAHGAAASRYLHGEPYHPPTEESEEPVRVVLRPAVDYFLLLPAPFDNGEQHDALAVVKALLTQVEVWTTSSESSSSSSRTPLPVEAQDTSESLVRHYFGGCMVTVVECLQCCDTRVTTESTIDWDVPLYRPDDAVAGASDDLPSEDVAGLRQRSPARTPPTGSTDGGPSLEGGREGRVLHPSAAVTGDRSHWLQRMSARKASEASVSASTTPVRSLTRGAQATLNSVFSVPPGSVEDLFPAHGASATTTAGEGVSEAMVPAPAGEARSASDKDVEDEEEGVIWIGTAGEVADGTALGSEEELRYQQMALQLQHAMHHTEELSVEESAGCTVRMPRLFPGPDVSTGLETSTPEVCTWMGGGAYRVSTTYFTHPLHTRRPSRPFRSGTSGMTTSRMSSPVFQTTTSTSGGSHSPLRHGSPVAHSAASSVRLLYTAGGGAASRGVLGSSLHFTSERRNATITVPDPLVRSPSPTTEGPMRRRRLLRNPFLVALQSTESETPVPASVSRVETHNLVANSAADLVTQPMQPSVAHSTEHVMARRAPALTPTATATAQGRPASGTPTEGLILRQRGGGADIGAVGDLTRRGAAATFASPPVACTLRERGLEESAHGSERSSGVPDSPTREVVPPTAAQRPPSQRQRSPPASQGVSGAAAPFSPYVASLPQAVHCSSPFTLLRAVSSLPSHSLSSDPLSSFDADEELEEEQEVDGDEEALVAPDTAQRPLSECPPQTPPPAAAQPPNPSISTPQKLKVRRPSAGGPGSATAAGHLGFPPVSPTLPLPPLPLPPMSYYHDQQQQRSLRPVSPQPHAEGSGLFSLLLDSTATGGGEVDAIAPTSFSSSTTRTPGAVLSPQLSRSLGGGQSTSTTMVRHSANAYAADSTTGHAAVTVQYLLYRLLHPLNRGEELQRENAVYCTACGQRTATRVRTILADRSAVCAVESAHGGDVPSQRALLALLSQIEKVEPPSENTPVVLSPEEPTPSPPAVEAFTAVASPRLSVRPREEGLPLYFHVQLHRFSCNADCVEKLYSPIALNQVLLVPHLTQPPTGGDAGSTTPQRLSIAYAVYQLTAIVMHTGETQSGGQYFTLVQCASPACSDEVERREVLAYAQQLEKRSAGWGHGRSPRPRPAAAAAAGRAASAPQSLFFNASDSSTHPLTPSLGLQSRVLVTSTAVQGWWCCNDDQVEAVKPAVMTKVLHGTPLWGGEPPSNEMDPAPREPFVETPTVLLSEHTVPYLLLYQRVQH